MLCWRVRMLLPHSQRHVCSLEHFVTKKQTITALSQLIITAGWAGGRKAEQRDHWDGEKGGEAAGRCHELWCLAGYSVVSSTLSKALEEGESHQASPGDRDCSHRAAHLPGRPHQGSARALQYLSPTSHLQIPCLTFLSHSTTTPCACSECQESCIFPQCLTPSRALQPGCAGCSHQGWDGVQQLLFAVSVKVAAPKPNTVSRPFPVPLQQGWSSPWNLSSPASSATPMLSTHQVFLTQLREKTDVLC